MGNLRLITYAYMDKGHYTYVEFLGRVFNGKQASKTCGADKIRNIF